MAKGDPASRLHSGLFHTLTMPAANRAKGLMFHNVQEYLRDHHGTEALRRTIAELPAEVREATLSGGLVRGGWYPLSWYRDLHGAAQRALQMDEGLARLIGRLTTERDLTSGIYRVFMGVVSPAFVITRAPKLFNQYFETGTMSITLSLEQGTGGDVTASWTGCSGFDRNLWLDVLGGCQGALRAAGARGVTAEILTGGHDGQSHMTAVASWRL